MAVKWNGVKKRNPFVSQPDYGVISYLREIVGQKIRLTTAKKTTPLQTALPHCHLFL